MCALNDAGARLCGSHDFRNFCKMDVNNGVVNYTRSIESVRAVVISKEKDEDEGPYDMCELTVKGKAFLWHQIRCIVSVLFRVGEGKEVPDVVDQLLDVEANPSRPQYTMASEVPLNLFACEYPEGEAEWVHEPEAVAYVLRQFQAMWAEHQVKASMLRAALSAMEGEWGQAETNQVACLLPKSKAKTYTPLLEMLKCPSLEEKMAKRRKLKQETD